MIPIEFGYVFKLGGEALGQSALEGFPRVECKSVCSTRDNERERGGGFRTRVLFDLGFVPSSSCLSRGRRFLALLAE